MGSELPCDQPSTVGPPSSNEMGSQGPARDVADVPAMQAALIAALGRYEFLSVLGAGGFGVVHRAFDKELKREVAIKIPRGQRVHSRKDSEVFLAEARALARLDHPGIVPVYDVGRTDDGLCFLVSKFIEGTDLRNWMRRTNLSHQESARIVALVAEALHHAHQRGLVHRDIKPANILLDAKSRPTVVDFGLALRKEDFGKKAAGGGTPQYMSPEQAGGEGHRVDARSDVYSLGVVLYELLTGQRPFTGVSDSEVLERIRSEEARPPRQISDSVPRELDRICVKALAKRALDRYSTAGDFAEDLRHWLGKEESRASSVRAAEAPGVAAAAANLPRTISASDTDQHVVRIVPKGLRSFDAGDADFFVDLLPGPRDRDRLPESLRFWKKRIEETDPDKTFSVGLLYGPSGCGKSSLVKAGLLPQLADRVITILIEVTAEGTEQRLLSSLRRCCPELPADENLAKSLSNLRRGYGLRGKKLLLVLDQFEQWLHASRDEPAPLLVRALRQCDGEHVQALLLVRDDFWMATTRFLRALEVPLLEGRNSGAVDLFDLRHGRKVLAAFGRAFGAMPETDESQEQRDFIERAVAGLAEDGKIIPVRLSLFAEMVKHKHWTPATLKKMGGPEGVGVAFLEETFSDTTAPPEHRLHQKAARAVLEALLPQQGAELKGHMRSYDELLGASGYQSWPRQFEDLLRILDAEVRLITPSDPQGAASGTQTTAVTLGESLDSMGTTPALPSVSVQRFYQLTHDYLVPVLRRWLTHKRKETWRGRAQLRLREHTIEWLAGQQRRFLPSLWEFTVFQLGVPGRIRKPDEQTMMQSAAKHLASRWGLALALLLMAGIVIERYVASVHRNGRQNRAEVMVERLAKAPPSDVPDAIASLLPLRDIAVPLMHDLFQKSAVASRSRLHAAYGLAALGEVPNEYLVSQMPTVPPSEAANTIAALGHADAAVRSHLLQKARVEENPDAKARYAIVLLHLGDPHSAKEVLALVPDPTARAALIFALKEWHGDLQAIPDMLRSEPDGGFRSGLCAAVGRMDPASFSDLERSKFESAFQYLFESAPDGGTHSAAGWALRQWKVQPVHIEGSTNALKKREWFVNRHGITMLQMPAGKLAVSERANVLPHKKTRDLVVSRSFFVSDTEISVQAFRQFVRDSASLQSNGVHDWPGPHPVVCQGDNCPVHNVAWYDAVRFCNWLSVTEGRRPCYTCAKIAKQESAKSAVERWEWDEEADGYRLPTESEWECACRGGTTTLYHFGNVQDPISEYGFLLNNSKGMLLPVGTKLPNNWGVFDMVGNVAEWGWNKISGDSKERDDRLVLGSNAFEYSANSGRSVEPTTNRASAITRTMFIGFRIVCNAERNIPNSGK